MRLIFTILLFQLFSISYGQKNCRIPIPNVGCITYNRADFKLIEKVINHTETPLFVVDGVPLSDTNELKDVDSNDIESLNILEESDILTIGFCRPRRSIIVITTKSYNLREFIIKDFLDGNRISGATVSFISANKRDTIMALANDSGIVITDKLKSSVNYQLSVSAVGYKTLNEAWKRDIKKNNELLLERDVKICDEVVIRTDVIKCGRICIYKCTRVSDCSIRTITDTTYKNSSISAKFQLTNGRIFPNPAQRGKLITIETTAQSDGLIEVRITSMDGKLVFSQPQKAIKGLNRITLNTDYRWSSGIYLVQLYANGKLLASDKVVIQ